MSVHKLGPPYLRKARRKESAKTWTALLDAIKAGDTETADRTAQSLVHGSRDMAVRLLTEDTAKT
jgi:DNA-binding FadR family transcriptional regulator